MKRTLWIITPVLLLSLNAWAHDPSEHMKNSEKADCSAMQGMDQSKMDMNDPVMQAMMQKCMHQKGMDHHDDDDDEDDGHHHDGHMSGDDDADDHHPMH